jgi:peptide/nickel transport system ATP-binding protein
MATATNCVAALSRCHIRQAQQELGLSYLFISHDLGVIHHIADRVLVMRDGQVVESGTAAEVFESPRDPYTRQLLASVPVAEPEPSIGGLQ